MNIHHHKRIEEKTLKLLLGAEGDCLVSILMPTHVKGQEVRQDPIRFRNLLKAARHELSGRAELSDEAQSRFDTLAELVDREGELQEFWRRQQRGLAVFTRPGTIHTVRLPREVDEFVGLGPCFHLRPLLGAASQDQHFYIMVASQDELHMLTCDGGTWKEVSDDALPEGRESITQYLEEIASLQHHTGSAGRGRPGHQTAIYHGHGSPDTAARTRTLEYFQQVNRGLHEMSLDYRTPIVFAGVDYIFSIFKDAIHDMNLIRDDHVSGNFDEVRADFDDVHARARDIVQQHFGTKRDEALENYGNAAGAGQTSTEIEEIVIAASDGRIAWLFADPQATICGSFDADARIVHAASRTESSGGASSEDLINRAAVLTVRSGGKVLEIERDRMPDRQPVAAMFRY